MVTDTENYKNTGRICQTGTWADRRSDYVGQILANARRCIMLLKNDFGDIKMTFRVKTMNRISASATIIVAVSLMTAGCAKKTIDTVPHGRPSVSTPAGEETAAGTAAAGSDPDQGVREEGLAESGERSRNLSAAAIAERDTFENQDILFEFDSAVLSKTAQTILRDKAQWLLANAAVTVIIEGHCDDRGTNEYNLALGEKRAQSAQSFLLTLGVDLSRMSTVSYGEERPLVDGVSEEVRARNRRAHFVIER